MNIAEAVDAYEIDLTGRGRDAYNAVWVRGHLPPHLAAQPLSKVTSREMRVWRDGLIKGGMLPATVNRLMKAARAAFKLAAKLDPRIAANAEAWRVGLEALPDTVTARDAVLTEKQVMAVVAATYDISAAFGLYVQAHAETGARSSQIARCVVGDLHRDKRMIPSSRKGRGSKPRSHIGVPLTPGLAARLRQAAAGRAAHEPLFLRAGGAPWRPSYERPPRSLRAGGTRGKAASDVDLRLAAQFNRESVAARRANQGI